MSRSFVCLVSLVAGARVIAACSANAPSHGFDSGSGGAAKDENTSSSKPTTVGAGLGPTGGTDCSSAADEDKDKDGYSVTQGDCNDCDANVNPGAIEVIATA